jgi:uncharacterized protein YuzE
MNVTIAGTVFNNNEYDAVGDVLYLNVGNPDDGVDFDDTPEGHNVGWNAEGEIVSIALLHPRSILAKHGKIELTIPERHLDVDAAAIDAALLAA